MNFFKLYILAFILFLIIDFLWLGLIAKNFYRDNIGFLLADEFKLLPGLIFYFIYIFGLVYFSIYPSFISADLSKAFFTAALFGVVCYGTYDLTNYATVKNWPLKVVIVDLIWGFGITSITAFVVTWIALKWKAFF